MKCNLSIPSSTDPARTREIVRLRLRAHLVMTPAPQQIPENFAPPLVTLLRAELAAGNEIAEVGPSMADPHATMVLLSHRFRAAPAQPPAEVAFRVINDPHWWYAEYVHTASKDCLACRA